MSSFLCFICHSTVNADTIEEMREKYRDVVGMNLCPDSHLCHICCHVMNRLWLFKSVCLKRSLEYPVLFSEKGTLNLQRNDLEIHTICFEDCEHYKSRNVNSKYCHFTYFDGTSDDNEKDNLPNDYVKLEDERREFDELLNNKKNYKHHDNVDDLQKELMNEKTNYQLNTTVHNEEFDFQTNYNTNIVEFGDRNYYNQDDETQPKLVMKSKYQNTAENREIFQLQSNYQKGIEELSARVVKTNFTQNEDMEVPSKMEITNSSQCDEMKIHETDQVSDLDESEQKDDVYDEYSDHYESNDEETNDKDLQIKDGQKSPIQPNENISEDVEKSEKPVKKKKNKAKKEKYRFKKIILSVEEQRAELEARRKEKKYIEAEFKCYNCALGFLFKDTYQTHMMRHEESNGEYLCSICSLRFATLAVLRAHTSLHAERHRCGQCNALIRRRQRTDHARICYQLETDTASCHLCGRVFKDSNGLQQHLKRFHRSKSTGRTYACNVCGERCSDPAAVRTHMIKHIQRKFQCSLCTRSFSSPYSLRAHCTQSNGKHIQRKFQCSLCTRSFSSPYSLRAHCIRHERRNTYDCACGAQFSDAKGLRAHRKTTKAHAETSFECPICGRSCPTERSLASHISTVHSSSKQHECPACPARYTSRKSLVRHLASHKRRPCPVRAVCHLCGASFKGNSKLNRHLREVCEKDKLEEELSSYYAQENGV